MSCSLVLQYQIDRKNRYKKNQSTKQTNTMCSSTRKQEVGRRENHGRLEMRRFQKRQTAGRSYSGLPRQGGREFGTLLPA